jgi:penicillin amidase
VVGKLLAFLLSFELDTARTTAFVSYATAGAVLGFDGQKLFSQDLWRSAAFEPNATVPDASNLALPARHTANEQRGMERAQEALADEQALKLMRDHLDAVRDIPLFQSILHRQERGGSNLWAVSGQLTQHGRALIANDPHLPLPFPSQFFPMGLEFADEPVFGSTIAGIPGVIHGYNSRIAWGSTNNAVDVTDTFLEKVVLDASSPSGLSTVYQGQREPLIPIPQSFSANVGGTLVSITGSGIPAATLVMTRRDMGPLVQLTPPSINNGQVVDGSALSVQYVGFGPTQELEAFLLMNRARNLDDFQNALQRLDVGSQNFVYGDVEGNIAYFTSGEIPVREDLQNNTVNGAPPWLVRNGQGGNEWLAVQHPQPYQATALYEILPFSELPQIVNPPAGYLVNANNDPAGLTRDNDPLNQFRPCGRGIPGAGLCYMAYQWNRGFRAARIESRLHDLLQNGNGRVSLKEMQAIQGDVIMRDAQVFTPYIVNAFDRALSAADVPAELRALAQNAGVAEAVSRLRRWDGAAATGIAQGYDFHDKPGELQEPSQKEIAASTAASIYAAWRSSVLSTVIDGTLARLYSQLPPVVQSKLNLPTPQLPSPIDEDSLTALRNILDHFDSNSGRGTSGVDFFADPGIPSAVTAPADRRDFVILSSVRTALGMLSGPAFAAAFNGSTNQNDYRWGLLHRVVLAHPLGSIFSVPPAGGAFPQPLAGLPGIPVDGGFQTVDAATHNARGKAANQFMFDWGPAHRMVVELRGGAIHAEDVWAGGTSGVVGSPGYVSFLERWLTNETLRLSLGSTEVARVATTTETYVP